MRKGSLTLILATIFLVALSSTARAEIFTANLSGAQEVPAVATTATGWARIVVNESAGTLQFTVFFQGLSSAQNASHIHAPAAIGASTGVAINFGVVGGTTGTISGNAAITPTQLAQLRQGLGYVNVHSANNPGGEIRGQLAKQRPVDFDGSVQIRNDWGIAQTDFPAPGDYDGDAKADIAIYRTDNTTQQNAYWIIQSSNNTVRYFAWGVPGDQTHQRDYDGDGITDPCVFRRGVTAGNPAFWYIRNSATGTARVEQFGTTGDGTNSDDFPVSGDYDGDGKFDLAIYRFNIAPVNNFIIKQSSDGVITFRQFGNFASDYILPGDYDGDGKYDLAIARTGATTTAPLVWWILQSSNGQTRTQTFGVSNDIPVQGDYDGDSRTDIAIWRDNASATGQTFFWVNNSFTNSTTVRPWGVGADFVVNSFDAR